MICLEIFEKSMRFKLVLYVYDKYVLINKDTKLFQSAGHWCLGFDIKHSSWSDQV